MQAHTEVLAESEGPWRKENLSFNAAYNNERIPAWLFLPRQSHGPFQAIVLFSGVWAKWSRLRPPLNAVEEALITGFIESGRAIIYPVYKGTYERRFADDSRLGPVGERDWNVQMVKDVSRTIDYLSSREDIRAGEIAFCGYSWGATLGVIVAAIEPRLKANVLVVGGFHGAGIEGLSRVPNARNPLPEADQINFAPRATIPTLMLNGRYDPLFPLDTSQRPMFQWLGTAPAHKRHVVYDTGHDVPLKQVEAEIRAWLDQYLGPAQ